ncbi:MAG TPA: hypothetical protein VHT73_11955 [Thermodesulfobacteriota bacterium]|nr:hypothetical protein [Thermodesulfobacteriota bacterium]
MARDTKGRFKPGPDKDRYVFKSDEGYRFRKGQDPKRHQLTYEERSRGFWSMVESIGYRYPGAKGKDGRHIVCNALKYLNGKRKK